MNDVTSQEFIDDIIERLTRAMGDIADNLQERNEPPIFDYKWNLFYDLKYCIQNADSEEKAFEISKIAEDCLKE